MFGLSLETADLWTQLDDLTDTIFVIVILLSSKSTSYIQLKSDNPLEYPKIQPLTNYLGTWYVGDKYLICR